MIKLIPRVLAELLLLMLMGLSIGTTLTAYRYSGKPWPEGETPLKESLGNNGWLCLGVAKGQDTAPAHQLNGIEGDDRKVEIEETRGYFSYKTFERLGVYQKKDKQLMLLSSGEEREFSEAQNSKEREADGEEQKTLTGELGTLPTSGLVGEGAGVQADQVLKSGERRITEVGDLFIIREKSVSMILFVIATYILGWAALVRLIIKVPQWIQRMRS